MADLHTFGADPWALYLLIFARVAAAVSLIPYFSWPGIPVFWRVFLSAILSWLIGQALPVRPPLVPGSSAAAVWLLAREAAVGLALGSVIALFFSLFTQAGQLMDLGAGTTMAAVFSPQTGGQVTLLGRFYHLLVLIYYLAVDGHYHLIAAMVESCRYIPLGGGLPAQGLALGLGGIFARIFVLAFQMAAPVMVIMLTLDLSLGLVAKTVPQIHVFVEGLPIKIALSLVIVAILLPLMAPVWDSLLGVLSGYLYQFMEAW